MSVTKRQITNFKIKRVDDKYISLEVSFLHSGYENSGALIMTDGEFDLLMETIIAFTDSEPDKEVQFAETA